MRKFLYSKWFFAFLAAVCTLDLISDVTADFFEWHGLRAVTFGFGSHFRLSHRHHVRRSPQKDANQWP
jgi:hypothetical protein